MRTTGSISWVTAAALLALTGCTPSSEADGGADLGAPDMPTADSGGDGGVDAGPADLGSDGGPACTLDADGDGYFAASCGGNDCDDASDSVHPGAAELCNGMDDDCNGTVDDPAASASSCVGIPHGVVACIGGACALSGCDVGYGMAGAACVAIGAPRPTAPLSTATATSQRPTLHWELPSSADGAHVDLCADRACATVISTIEVTGTSGAPSSDLPAGVLFWRVRGMLGAALGTDVSPTWELFLRHRSAPLDTAWGSTFDPNGDGLADLAITAVQENMGTGAVYVFAGGAAGVAAAPTTSLRGPDGVMSFFGFATASAADVNGDGYGDLIVGAFGVASRAGAAYLYLGGPSGLDSAGTTLPSPTGMNGDFGDAVGSAGDVNGDGYGDVIVGAEATSTGTGSAYVFLGGAAGIGTSPAIALAGPDGAHGFFGGTVASAADINGDGYADQIIGAYGVNGHEGRVYVFFGGALGVTTAASNTLVGPDGMGRSFGEFLDASGDMNGDGYADVVVAEMDGVYVFPGGVAGVSSSSRTHYTPPDGASTGFGAIGRSGDVTGDGYDDLVVGAGTVGPNIGSAYLYVGAALALTTTPMATLVGPDGPNGYFGQASSVTGDVDGDGYADVVVGAGNAMGGGRAFLFAGGTSGVSASATATLESPAGGTFGVPAF